MEKLQKQIFDLQDLRMKDNLLIENFIGKFESRLQDAGMEEYRYTSLQQAVQEICNQQNNLFEQLGQIREILSQIINAPTKI